MRPDGNNQHDHYATLGVARTATRAQIAKAYRRLAFTWHPDRNPERAAEASARFVVIQAAYDVLSDARQRADYDIAHMPPRVVEPARQPPEAASLWSGGAPAATLPARAVSGVASVIVSVLVATVGFAFIAILGPRFAGTNAELFARWRRGKKWWIVTVRAVCVLAVVESIVALPTPAGEPAPRPASAGIPGAPASSSIDAAFGRAAETIANGVFSADPETRHTQAITCLVLFLALLLLENIVFALIWLAHTLETARGKTR